MLTLYKLSKIISFFQSLWKASLNIEIIDTIGYC